MKTTILLLLAGVSAIQLESYQDCTAPKRVCPQPEYKLSCPKPQSAGYGKITSRSKEQQQEAAEARNQYDHQNAQLAYEGQNNQVESQKEESSGQGSLTEIINISGTYAAEQKLTETEHGKSAETGKGATCFRREAFQHLNQIGKTCDYDALSDRNLNNGAGSYVAAADVEESGDD